MLNNTIAERGSLSLLRNDSTAEIAADVISQLGDVAIRRSMAKAVRNAVGERGDSEDIVSEALVRAIEHADSYDWSKGSIVSWACRIAANTARNWVKACRNSRVHVSAVTGEDESEESIFESMPGADGREVVGRRAEMAAIAANMAKLDADTQTVLDAMVGGMGQCEAGKLVGWSPATTTRRVRAAMAALADAI